MRLLAGSGHTADGEIHAIRLSREKTADGRRLARAPGGRAHLAMVVMVGFLPSCASAPLVQGSALSSYDAMAPSDGMITKSRIHVKKEHVLAATTVNILRTTFSPTVAPRLTDEQRLLVANAIDRSLCISLSDRFTVVAPDQPADLTIRAAVTQVTETNEIAAGVSAAASFGMNFVSLAVPVPTPRIPIGLGNLSVEAEAVDASGKQQASMLWGKGAMVLFSSPKISKASDAYDLADAFGEDFGSLLVKGESPFEGGPGIELPTGHKIKSTMGLAPKHVACERHGRAPGIAGFVGGQFGLPPEWTDKGASKAAP